MVVDGVGHQFVPDDACSDAQQHFVGLRVACRQFFYCANAGMQNRPVVVGQEQKVTAAADVQQGGLSNQLCQFFRCVVLDKATATRIDAKGVVVEQRIVFFSSHRIPVSSCHPLGGR